MSDSTASNRPTRGRPWLRWLTLLALLGAAGITLFLVLLSSWSETHEVDAAGAEAAFEELLEGLTDRRPYLTIRPGGEVEVDRTLEGDEPASLRTLGMLAWNPEVGRLSQVDFPWWFVRVKLSSELDLGTLTAALVGDWDSISLSVGPEELSQRGPGLILDHRPEGGGRLLLWCQ